MTSEQLEMDEALEALYSSDGTDDEEISRDEWETATPGRKHGAVKGRTFPRVAKWLDQLRNFFPSDCVVLLEKEAIERRGIEELLFEAEMLAKVEPSIDSGTLPGCGRDSARDSGGCTPGYYPSALPGWAPPLTSVPTPLHLIPTRSCANPTFRTVS